MSSSSHRIITISGSDSPGITAAIAKILADQQMSIVDLGQAVIHGLLSLSFLVRPEDGAEINEDILGSKLTSKAKEMGLRLEFAPFSEGQLTRAGYSTEYFHYAITLIADRISAAALHEVTKSLAQWKMNIDEIKRLSEGDFSCIEIIASTPKAIQSQTLRKELLEIARKLQVDIALQTEGLYRRSKRLIVLDMDSTLIQSEVIDELAKEKGVYDEVAAITHQAMQGQMDFNQSLILRCEKLQGLTLKDLDQVVHRIQLTPGAFDLIQFLKRLGYKIAVISGGFTFVAQRLKEQLGLDFAYANTLEIHNGVLTGKVTPPIVNAQRKADLLEALAQQENIVLDQVIAVGDGANDLLMLEKAGLGIAFNAKPVVCEKADLALNQRNLRSILYLLGFNARDLNQVLGRS